MTPEYYYRYVFPLVIALKVTLTSHVEKDLAMYYREYPVLVDVQVAKSERPHVLDHTGGWFPLV